MLEELALLRLDFGLKEKEKALFSRFLGSTSRLCDDDSFAMLVVDLAPFILLPFSELVVSARFSESIIVLFRRNSFRRYTVAKRVLPHLPHEGGLQLRGAARNEKCLTKNNFSKQICFSHFFCQFASKNILSY